MSLRRDRWQPKRQPNSIGRTRIAIDGPVRNAFACRNPNWVGRTQRRSLALNTDRKIIRAPLRKAKVVQLPSCPYSSSPINARLALLRRLKRLRRNMNTMPYLIGRLRSLVTRALAPLKVYRVVGLSSLVNRRDYPTMSRHGRPLVVDTPRWMRLLQGQLVRERGRLIRSTRGRLGWLRKSRLPLTMTMAFAWDRSQGNPRKILRDTRRAMAIAFITHPKASKERVLQFVRFTLDATPKRFRRRIEAR